MLIELLLFLFLGILAGTLTGLFPGIHINLIGALLISASASFLFFIPAIYLIVFIVSMAITHTFLAFIPSVLLGAPEDGTELSVLPGHDMLKKGLGLQAVSLTSLGCLYGVFVFIIAAIPLFFITKNVYEVVRTATPFILIATSLSLIIMETKKLSAFFVFFLTGAFGLSVLNLGIQEPLLPLLSGLFGASGLLISIKSKTKIARQDVEKAIKIKKLKPILSAALVSPLSIFLPAVSPGQVATIGNQVVKLGREGFLFLLGIVNLLAMAFSFLALFLISKTRTGSAVAVKELVGVLDLEIFILIIIIILISGVASFFITKFIAKRFVLFLEKVEYSKVSLAVLAIIFVVVFLVSGLAGIAVFIIASLTGIYCILLGVKRTHMMGCLLLPTIIIYLF